jgi:DNA-binding NarL/FixJ family response regulator
MPDASAAGSERGLPTLVIADDDAEVRALLAMQLAEHFAVVATAADADAAIALGTEHRPDLALVGMQMPGGAGIDITRGLHLGSPGSAIVAFSGDESDGLARDVIAAGATAYLPAGISRAELTLALLEAHAASGNGQPLPTLLIADDDADLREMLAIQLGKHFTVVATAADADEAIALGAEHRPDIATIDMQMPGGGGLSATRELHRRSPGTAIVALSGDESDAIVREVIASGATSYLRKGIARADLALALRGAMSAHRTLHAS